MSLLRLSAAVKTIRKDVIAFVPMHFRKGPAQESPALGTAIITAIIAMLHTRLWG